MSETLLIDESWTRADPKAIKAAGYIGVIGYISHDKAKCMTRARAQALHAEDLVVCIVFEDAALRATEGAAAGTADRAFMAQQAKALGYPAACDRFYACDTDATAEQALPYYKVTADDVSGPYGDLRVLEAVHGFHPTAPKWETQAWDGTEVSGIADLYQRVGKTRPKIAGVMANAYDENVVLRPLTLWGPKGPQVVRPAGSHKPPKPAPKPHPKPVKAKGMTPFTGWMVGWLTRYLRHRKAPFSVRAKARLERLGAEIAGIK